MHFVNGLVEKTHVGYIVKDVDAAVAQLQEQLQCALNTQSYIFSPTKAWTNSVPLEGFALKIAICKIKDNMVFEYIQPISENGYHYQALMSDGEGLNHVCFATEDFDGYHKEFEKMGAEIVFEAEANDPLNGYRRCFYAKLNGLPGVFEVQENAKPYRE